MSRTQLKTSGEWFEATNAALAAVPHLHGAVEEAAVLARFVHQAFGECEGHHAAWLVGLLQASSRFLKHLGPRLGIGACN